MFSSQRPSACRAKAVSQGRQRGEAAEQPGDRVSSSRGSHICLICLDAVEQLGLLVCDCTLRFIVEQHVHQHQETSSRPPDSGSTSRAASAIAHKLSFAQKPSFGPQRRATAAQRRSTAGQGPRSSRAAGAAAQQRCRRSPRAPRAPVRPGTPSSWKRRSIPTMYRAKTRSTSTRSGWAWTWSKTRTCNGSRARG